MLPRDTWRRSGAGSTIGRRRSWSIRSTFEFDLGRATHGGHGHARLPPQSLRGPRDRNAPLALDGEQQDDVRVELDGAPLAAPRLRFGDGTLRIVDAPDSGTLTIRSRIAPARNVALEGLYVSSGVFCTQCEPEGFRRITYFPDRPDVLARYTVTLRADRATLPGAAVQRQSRRAGSTGRRPPLCDVARSRSPSRRTSSRWWPAIWPRSRIRSRRRPGARSR